MRKDVVIPYRWDERNAGKASSSCCSVHLFNSKISLLERGRRLSLSCRAESPVQMIKSRPWLEVELVFSGRAGAKRLREAQARDDSTNRGGESQSLKPVPHHPARCLPSGLLFLGFLWWQALLTADPCL